MREREPLVVACAIASVAAVGMLAGWPALATWGYSVAMRPITVVMIWLVAIRLTVALEWRSIAEWPLVAVVAVGIAQTVIAMVLGLTPENLPPAVTTLAAMLLFVPGRWARARAAVVMVMTGAAVVGHVADVSWLTGAVAGRVNAMALPTAAALAALARYLWRKGDA